jgi:UV DNA damage endonuclease
MIRNKGVCCIVLALEENDPPLKFRTMTYKSFSSLIRAEALVKLGGIILNNLLVTEKAIEYCGVHNHNYRLSSNIFPLMTYDKASLLFEEFPQLDDIVETMDKIKQTREQYNVRLSSHPDQFNVLASENDDAVTRTIIELDFHGWFMTRIGCPLSYESPINIHVNRSPRNGDIEKVRNLFYENFHKLSDHVKSRLVLENDDKAAGWVTQDLYNQFYSNGDTPITFDYLHHKCHNLGTSEEESFDLAASTWGEHVPLFHYSESIPGDRNPRKHADRAVKLPRTYETTIDLDFEFKMKEKSFENL